MNAPSAQALEAVDLGVALGGKPVLQHVSARFEPGRISVLLGPNGAGKSTLLACLAGLRRPDSGRAMLGGVNVVDLDRRDRARRIGLLPQPPEVHWDIDVATLVSLGRLPHRGRGGETAADRRATAAAMQATDVMRLAERPARQLSGGERGRVLLARVLAGEPHWLLADEPLANLDPAHQLDVLDQLRRIAREGMGVVLVVHDLNFAARVADFAVLMRDGRILASGPGEAVLRPGPVRDTFGIDAHFGTAADADRFVVPLRRNRG